MDFDAELNELAAEGLTGGIDRAFREEYLSPNPESFMRWLKLLRCDRMYRSAVYDDLYAALTNPECWRLLILLPRGAFKSTALCAAKLREVVLNRDYRILYTSETATQAGKYVGWMRSQMEENDELIRLVGKFKPGHRGHPWGDGELWVEGRRDLSKKEPTVTAKGIEQVKAGPHFDDIVVDDPCSPENSKTKHGLESAVEAFKHIIPIAEVQVDAATGRIAGRTKLTVSCTRYNDADLLGYVKRMNDAILRRREGGDATAEPWKVIEVPAEDRKGRFFFPHLPQAVLRQMENEMGPRVYSAQMLLDPVPGDKAHFRREQFKLVPVNQLPAREYMWVYLLTDTATGAERRGDGVCLAAVGRDGTGRDFVLDMIYKEMHPSEVVKTLLDMYVKWGCRAALMEKISANECFAAMIDEQCIQRQIRVQLLQVGGRSTESKESRIESLEVPMAGGVLYWSSALPKDLIHVESDGKCYGEIVEQFVRFPSGAHDDIPDALSDLYKRDHMGSPLCPRPKPTNFRQNVISTVNGRMVNVQARPGVGGNGFWGDLQRQIGAGGLYNGRT